MTQSAKDTQHKVVTLEELLPIVERLKKEGKRIVSTNGCFDLIHPGHVENFEWAKSQGDVLVVGINSDASVRLNKGSKRPIVKERDRARVLAGLGAIDYVFIFDSKGIIPWITKLKSHVHVKGSGSEHVPAFEFEKKAVEGGGGEVRLAPVVEGFSTTNIIDKILARYSQK